MPTGPSLTPYGRKLRSRYAQTANRHGRKAPETMEAARTYRAEKLAEHVRHVLATEPALTNDERQALAALLCSPVDRHDGEVSTPA
ncbi:MAG TPA: hypothetical protein VGL46_16945 [Pseudonocardiaceae bacterium]|jgi:hypothetical protein